MKDPNKCVRSAMLLGIVAIGGGLLWDAFGCDLLWKTLMEGSNGAENLTVAINWSESITFVLGVMMSGMLALLWARSRMIAIVGLVGICAWIVRLVIRLLFKDMGPLPAMLVYELPSWSVIVGFFLLSNLVRGWKAKFVIGTSALAVLSSAIGIYLGFSGPNGGAGLRTLSFGLHVAVDVLELVSVVLIWRNPAAKGAEKVVPQSIRMISSSHSAGWIQTFIKIFAWSLMVIGALCSACMTLAAAPRRSLGETLPWDQGLVASAIVGLLVSIVFAAVVLCIVKADEKSAGIECPKRSAVIHNVQELSILGAIALAGVFVYSLVNEHEFSRVLVKSLLENGSSSGLLTLNRIVDNRDELLVLVRIMLVVWTWYWIGAYFVWGALARVLGRVVTASAMKEVYERKIRALEASQPKADEAKA